MLRFCSEGDGKLLGGALSWRGVIYAFTSSFIQAAGCKWSIGVHRGKSKISEGTAAVIQGRLRRCRTRTAVVETRAVKTDGSD